MTKNYLEESDDIIRYAPNKRDLILKIFKGIFILGFLFLICHLCIIYGALKERRDKNCIKGSELIMWQNTLEIAHAICVDVQQNQLAEIKENYETRVKIAEEETEKWKGYYNWQKTELNNLKEDNKQDEQKEETNKPNKKKNQSSKGI